MNKQIAAVAAACILPMPACASQSQLDLESDSEPRRVTTIAVTNSGMEPLKLYDRYGYLGHVGVGDTRCFAIRVDGPYWLTASFNAYSTVTTPAFLPETQPGWVWELATFSMKYDAMRILPADRPCKAGGTTRLARRTR